MSMKCNAVDISIAHIPSSDIGAGSCSVDTAGRLDRTATYSHTHTHGRECVTDTAGSADEEDEAAAAVVVHVVRSGVLEE